MGEVRFQRKRMLSVRPPGALERLRGLKLDLVAKVTFTATISACGKGMQWRQASKLLREMMQDSIAPDTITFSAASSACGQSMQGNRRRSSCAR